VEKGRGRGGGREGRGEGEKKKGGKKKKGGEGEYVNDEKDADDKKDVNEDNMIGHKEDDEKKWDDNIWESDKSNNKKLKKDSSVGADGCGDGADGDGCGGGGGGGADGCGCGDGGDANGGCGGGCDANGGCGGGADGGCGGGCGDGCCGSSSIFLEDITTSIFKEKVNSDKYISDNNKIIFIKNKDLKNINIKTNILDNKDGDGIIDYAIDVLTMVINRLIYYVNNIHYNKLIHYVKNILNYSMRILISLYNLFTNNNTKNAFNLIKNDNKHKDIFIKNKTIHKKKHSKHKKQRKQCKCNKHHKNHKKINSYLDTEKKVFLLKN